MFSYIYKSVIICCETYQYLNIYSKYTKSIILLYNNIYISISNYRFLDSYMYGYMYINDVYDRMLDFLSKYHFMFKIYFVGIFTEIVLTSKNDK